VDFDLDNRPYNLVDMETGEQMKLQPAEIREFYVNSIQTYLNELKLRCVNYRIDFMPTDLSKGYDQILLQYMLKRQKLF
ncbi:MAG: DUF58 domain-containing protein, partial [Flavobacteriia bacterium]